MTITVVLTGAAGVIGRAIAAELAGTRVIGLVRADAEPPNNAHTEHVPIDLGVRRLGLSDQKWRQLAAETDVIVHSGALAQWGRPWEEYRAANVDGTARVVDLAVSAGAPIYQLSTAMVFAGECGQLDSLAPDNVLLNYTRSKVAAEQLVGSSGLPHTIFRPTGLVGDSRTGASSAPQIVQRVADWFCRGKAPYFPAHPGNLVDLVPLDVIALAVACAVRAHDLGATYWLSYGDAAMSAHDVCRVLTEHAQEHGRPIADVPIVDPSGPLPVAQHLIPATSRAYLKVLTDLSAITQAWGGVLPTSMPLLHQRFGIPDGSGPNALRLSLQYWASERAS